MSEELKPCPFCGGEAGMFHGDSAVAVGYRYIKTTKFVQVFCGWCGATIRDSKEEDAVKKWNRRAEHKESEE